MPFGYICRPQQQLSVACDINVRFCRSRSFWPDIQETARQPCLLIVPMPWQRIFLVPRFDPRTLSRINLVGRTMGPRFDKRHLAYDLSCTGNTTRTITKLKARSGFERVHKCYPDISGNRGIISKQNVKGKGI